MKIILLFALSTYGISGGDPGGFWKGSIKTPQGDLAIQIELTHKDQSWKGTIDIPVQGLRGFALSDVKIDGEQVQFTMKGIPGEPRFSGKLDPSGDAMAGSFHQGPHTMNFSLNRAERGDVKETPFPMEPIAGSGAPGLWRGLLKAGPSKLRLELEVSVSQDGTLSGLLNSLDQGAKIPVDNIQLQDGKFSLEIKSIQATFSGEVNEKGSVIDGNWRQMGQVFPLEMVRVQPPSQGKTP